MPSWMKNKILKGLVIFRKSFRVLKDAVVSPEMKNKILRGLAFLRRRFRALKDAGVFLGVKNRILKGLAIFRRKSRTLKSAAALPEKHEMKKAARAFLGNTVIRDITFFLAFVAAAAWALYFIPPLQVADNITDAMQRFSAENEARKTLAQLIGGLVILVGVALGFRRVKAAEENAKAAQENVRVTQEGQITERFTRAVEQLGSENIHIRLGGIYALERIARDSKKDHWTIMEVLTAFIRERAKRNIAAEETEEDKAPKLPVDVQAALTVIGRRELAHEDEKTPRLDLRETDLRGADLKRASLGRAYLFGANLTVADLIGADLSGAFLEGTNLSEVDLSVAKLNGVHLFRANLRRAKLIGVNLGGAELTEANLSGALLLSVDLTGAGLRFANFFNVALTQANFMEADLAGANLHRADLSEAHNLTQEQIDSAITDENTKLPDYLKS